MVVVEDRVVLLIGERPKGLVAIEGADGDSSGEEHSDCHESSETKSG